MNKNVPVQAYFPPHLAAWLEAEARKAKVSRSHWICAVLSDLFQGQDLREESRAVTAEIQRELVYLVCAIDELLQVHPNPELRQRVDGAFRTRLEPIRSEQSK